jgi:hypothetical protein
MGWIGGGDGEIGVCVCENLGGGQATRERLTRDLLAREERWDGLAGWF